MVRKSTVGGALLSVMLVLQGCASGGAVQGVAQTHTRTAANDSAAGCSVKDEDPDECAEHAEIERELKALKARQPRLMAR